MPRVIQCLNCKIYLMKPQMVVHVKTCKARGAVLQTSSHEESQTP